MQIADCKWRQYVEMYKGCAGVYDCRCDHGDDEDDLFHGRLELKVKFHIICSLLHLNCVYWTL